MVTKERAITWLTERRRTRLDLLAMLGLGYVLGAHAEAAWWGIVIIIGSAMGLTDMTASLLLRLSRRTTH